MADDARTLVRSTDGIELQNLKEDLVTACRMLVAERASEGAFNISCRLADDLMLASPVTSPTLTTVDNLRVFPISETQASFKAHPAIYRSRPDVHAIVHVHAKYTVAFSILGEDFVPVHHYGAPFHGQLTTFRSPGQTASDERAMEMARQLGQNRVILQQGHGAIVVGHDIIEATLLTLFLEEACEMLYIARQMGKPQYLTLEQSRKIAPQILKPRSQNKAWLHYKDKMRISGFLK